jgi:quercetin dioxygenase-like cupin family protein
MIPGCTSGGLIVSRLLGWMLVGLMGGFNATLAHADGTDAPRSTVSTTVSKVLLQSDHSWDGKTYGPYPTGQPELTILKISIPAHTALPWHTHPVPNAGYVLSGTLHVETKDGTHQTTLHAGDVIPEMVGAVHRGRTDDAPVELVVFYAGAKGTPTAVKEP